MLASLVKTLLASNRHVSTITVPRARLFDNGRMFAPTMIEDVPRRNDVKRTVLSNVQKSDKLNTTVDGPTTN